MANKRIDQLPTSDNQVQGTDKIPIFSDGRTERITVDELGTYIGSNVDTYVTGTTYSNGTLTLGRNDGVDLTVNVDYRPYTVYTSLLTQSGTTAPTPVVLENTLSEVPTWNYVDEGEYTMTVTGSTFTVNKTWVIINAMTDAGSDRGTFGVERVDDNTIKVWSGLRSPNPVWLNDMLTNISFEVRVYN